MAPTARPHIPSPSRLPDSRAVVGGLLVALAVGLTLRAGAAADRPPSTRYLVATTDLDVGERLDRSDVAEVAIELPDQQRELALRAGDPVAGAVTLGPVRRGQLLAVTDLLAPAEGVTVLERELSLPVPRERALAGRVVPGELVDLLATTGAGAEAATTVVARAARVLAADAPAEGVGRGDVVVLTIAVRDDAEAVAVAHASATGELTVVGGVAP